MISAISAVSVPVSYVSAAPLAQLNAWNLVWDHALDAPMSPAVACAECLLPQTICRCSALG